MTYDEITDKVMAETVIVYETDAIFVTMASNLEKWDDPKFIKFLTNRDLFPTWTVWDENYVVDELVTDAMGLAYNLHFSYEVMGAYIKVWDVVLMLDDDDWRDW